MFHEKGYYIHLPEDYFLGGFFSEHIDEYLGLINQRISWLPLSFRRLTASGLQLVALHFSAQEAETPMQKYADFYMYVFSTYRVFYDVDICVY
jgi:hypothetical protein